MKTIYENEDICITDMEKDYDFIAIIENKSNENLHIDFIDDFMEDTIDVDNNNWIGILADEQGYERLRKLYASKYSINWG